MCCPNRLSEHYRTRDDTEPARHRKGLFSWSDKYVEKTKTKLRAEPLMVKCPSFVFVTLRDKDAQLHSPMCAVMCALCACVCAERES